MHYERAALKAEIGDLQFEDIQAAVFPSGDSGNVFGNNRPVEDWGKLLGDAAAVSAMLDLATPLSPGSPNRCSCANGC